MPLSEDLAYTLTAMQREIRTMICELAEQLDDPRVMAAGPRAIALLLQVYRDLHAMCEAAPADRLTGGAEKGTPGA